MEKSNEDQKLDNLKALYEELAEISTEEGAQIDLDLLFLDVLEALGLGAEDNLARITGEETAARVLEKVRDPV